MDIVEFESGQDSGRLASLIRDTFAAAYSHDMNPDHLTHHLKTELSNQAVLAMVADDTFYLAVQDNRWLGFIQTGWQATLGDVDLQSGDTLIHRLYVVAHAQNQGIGSALLQRVLNGTTQRHLLAVWHENLRAQILYRRFGFYQVGVRSELNHQGEYSGKDLILQRNGGDIRLRRFRAEDLPAFQAYRSNPELARYQGWQVQSDSKALAFITQMASIEHWQVEEWFQLAICDAGNTVIGDIGLCIHGDGSLEVGCSLHHAQHGKGVAAKAVRMALSLACKAIQQRSLPVSRFVAFTHEHNNAACRLLQRLNFCRDEEVVDQEYRFYLPLAEFKPIAYNYQID